jgi:hypothetical protein
VKKLADQRQPCTGSQTEKVAAATAGSDEWEEF